MEHRKPRIFFLTFYPPTPTMGGAMAYYRHFFERDDFEIFVATDDRRVLQFELKCPVLVFDQPRWLERLTRTRFSLWAHSFKHLVAGNFIPKEVLKAAVKFRPDYIFTIGGSWGWTTLMAQKLAYKLGVPLVGSFNDWFDFGVIIHPLMKPLLEERFRSFFRECDLAFCTSEGMKEALGPHHHAHVLYPVGSSPKEGNESSSITRNVRGPFVIVFAGNLSDWYGVMLEQLVETAFKMKAPVEFRIFGANQSWSSGFDLQARERKIYRGFLPFDQLGKEVAQADALILPMGFGQESALTERTSFKTKFLDYLAFRKPIIVWGPEYCSAVRVAREFDSAEICSDADPAAVVATLELLARSPERQRQLVAHAAAMYEDRFHPDKIHAGFVHHSLKLLGRV